MARISGMNFDVSLAAWRVQFTLTEMLSNPERVETRRANNQVQQQTGTGGSVADPSLAPEADRDGAQRELTGFERILQRVDDYIGPAG